MQISQYNITEATYLNLFDGLQFDLCSLVNFGGFRYDSAAEAVIDIIMRNVGMYFNLVD